MNKCYIATKEEINQSDLDMALMDRNLKYLCSKIPKLRVTQLNAVFRKLATLKVINGGLVKLTVNRI